VTATANPVRPAAAPLRRLAAVLALAAVLFTLRGPMCYAQMAVTMPAMTMAMADAPAPHTETAPAMPAADAMPATTGGTGPHMHCPDTPLSGDVGLASCGQSPPAVPANPLAAPRPAVVGVVVAFAANPAVIMPAAVTVVATLHQLGVLRM
jgi:hypothetical protein